MQLFKDALIAVFIILVALTFKIHKDYVTGIEDGITYSFVALNYMAEDVVEFKSRIQELEYRHEQALSMRTSKQEFDI